MKNSDTLLQQIDRYIDGELSADELTDMLIRCDSESNGWETCALALIESRELGSVLHDLVSESELSAPVSRVSPRRHYMASLTCVLGLMVAAFVGGRFSVETQAATPDLVEALPDRVTAAPAGTSGNFALGGHDPATGRDFVMYQLSGGGYGGNADQDGLANGCSTIGISKAPPVEIMEQNFPVLYHRYALREGSGGAGRHRGGLGLEYEVELRRGEARASFVMDHGRFGPQGALGGADGAVNEVEVWQDGVPHVPEHLSKAQDIPLKAGARVRVRTPGGGGFGDPEGRDPELAAEDKRLGRT